MLSTKVVLIGGGLFYFLFLLLTPLGLFNDWVPPLSHSGYYSVKTVDGGDDTGYYAYLRSIFFDGDLDFINERYYAHINRFNPTGYVFSNWQLGQSVLYLPFFLVGHCLALLYGVLGYPIKADGYSAPYFIGTAIASATYLLAGLMIMCGVLKKIVGEKIALITSMSIWVASPLLYYTFIRQRMAHTTEFFLAALFVMMWIYFRESNKKLHHAVMGTFLGLLCLVRLINANYGILYIADLTFLWFSGQNSASRPQITDTFKNFFCFIGMFLVVLLPQFIAWNQLNGFIISSYLIDTFQSQAMETSTSSAMLGSKVYDIFFSAKWGLAVATPLWFVGLLGLLIPGPVSRSIRFACLISVASLIVVILSFVESDAYGNRYLIAAAVLFAIGFANFLHGFFRYKLMRYVAVTFILTCVIAQYLMIMQYKVTLPYNHPQFSLEAFSRWTQIIFDHPILLLRSTNFFRLMGFEQVTWNFIDGIYLIIFPLAQLGCLAGVLYLFSGSIKSKRIFDIMLRPKNIVRAGILTSIVLVSIVVITAPDKSAEEIKRRVTYNNLLSTGDSLLAEKNFDAAQISFKQASALIPNLWIPYFKQGIVFGSQNKFEQAEEQYRIALDIYPDHPALLSNYGATLAILGRTEEAEPVLRNAIRQRPNNANAYNALAQVFIKQKKYQKAGDMLLLAVAVNPNFGTGHANLAMLYAMMNQREKAKAYLGKALQLGVNNLTTTNLQNFLHSPLKAP